MTDTQTPLKFVMVEFFGNFDSNAMKKRWVNEFHYEDITPPLPTVGRTYVPQFKTKPVIDKWPEFQNSLMAVEPDLLWVGGHHGRQFAADWDGKRSTWKTHCINQKETGFFNHAYHERTWKKHFNNGNPNFEVYMTTAHPMAPWPNPGPPGPPELDDNPFFAKVHSSCRCVLLIGCNSMTYPVARDAWTTFFPTALIIGMLETIEGGETWIRPFLHNDICSESFFRRPPTSLLELARVCYEVNRGLLIRPGAIHMQRAVSFAQYDDKTKTATAVNRVTGEQVHYSGK